MRAFLLLLALTVAACTTTPAHLYDSRPASLTLDSAKSPKALATCIADNMTEGHVEDVGAGHFAVIRDNGFGAIGRWDIYPTANGSRAEWRRASGLTTGEGAGKACA